VVSLLRFLEPYLRNAALSEAVRLLYRGTLRVLLVLLHDFPEFLCENHFALCDAIPPSCIQMRNLILSAFPRNMRLPDPFTPNLKVDLLPEITQAPRVLPDVDHLLPKLLQV
jgi:CCR4-NOT transcription complex subunit 1